MVVTGSGSVVEESGSADVIGEQNRGEQRISQKRWSGTYYVLIYI